MTRVSSRPILARNDEADPAAARARRAGAQPAPRRRGKTQRSPERLDERTLLPILGYRLAQASIVMRQVYQHNIGDPLSLRTVDFTVLMLLLVNEDATPTQISRTLAMSAPNLTQLLDRLAERGLVARQPSPHDRRAQHIRLTRAGRVLAKRAHEVSVTMEQESLRALSDAERAMLFELLQRVARLRAL